MPGWTDGVVDEHTAMGRTALSLRNALSLPRAWTRALPDISGDGFGHVTWFGQKKGVKPTVCWSSRTHTSSLLLPSSQESSAQASVLVLGEDESHGEQTQAAQPGRR